MRYCIRVTVATINGKGYWRYFNGKWSTNKSNGFPIAGFSKSNDGIKFYPTIDSAKEDAEKMQWVDGVFKVEIVEETTLVKKKELAM